MTTANPFAAARSATPAAKTAPATKKAAPAEQMFETAESTKPAAAERTAGQDPFAMPSGPGSGDKITDYIGELLLVKPEELIEGLSTSIGVSDAIRVDVAVLSGDAMGTTSEGMLVFQTALMRDLKKVLNGPSPYLLGRLGKGVAKQGKSAPFIFNQPDEEEMELARQFLAVNTL